MLQIHHHLLLLVFFINFMFIVSAGTLKIGVGVVLDMDSSVGKTSSLCIKMAIDDFYQTHHNYTTKIIPHIHHSESDTLQAASAAIQLLKYDQVIAIIGPHTSSQADFVVDIGNKSKVPILSLATSTSISPIENPYFIRVSHNSSSQAQPIAALIKHFTWREVVFVYEQSDFGRGLLPYLSEALLNIGAHIKYRSVISPSPSHAEISEELNKLKENQARVFVVHLSPKSASLFFKKANETGMMQKGYVWIITDVLTSLLHTLDISSMQGVVGVKPYIPKSIKLNNFEKRWRRRFHTENPNLEMERIELDVFGIWSYDATYALAMALERVGSDIAPTFHRKNNPVTDLDAIGTSKLGPRLLSEIGKTRLNGLSGDFSVVDGQLQPLDYQIVSVIEKEERFVGLWTWHHGISENLRDIKWPGNSNSIPQGLRVGYPSNGVFPQFISNSKDNNTNEDKPTGFCVEVFEAVMEALQPQAPPYGYNHYTIDDGHTSRSYDDLVYQIFLKKFDMVIGDVTIRANRSNYVDFTLPYTESGVSMIVPIKVDDRKGIWIFLKPLEKGLWLTSFAFFIYTGVVVWILEHRVNKEFRGRPYKQVGMIFWFSFSTLVFAHKEKTISNLSRFVVIVWIFVVIVLQSSYTAGLTSMLTVQQLQPDFTDIHDLLAQGDYVGYKDGSFVGRMLLDMGFNINNLKKYTSLEDYHEALSKGSKNGGVSAIFEELPYVNAFMAKYCTKYIKVGPTYKTAGFGFAFPLGSPLVPLVSRAILEVREKKLSKIWDIYFKPEKECTPKNETAVTPDRLSLDSFIGLFLIAGISSTSALMISILKFLYENRGILASEDSICQKMYAMARTFDQENDQSSYKGSKKTIDALGTTDDDDLSVIEDDITSNAPSPESIINHEAPDIVETTIER
ncbi:glutamate receptor 2.8-like [Cynara cardunculus var. scolymus]|uniref:Glutamate receptor n=1 Tax=Cynara cardunculus var. scolymus TaxID=59895 RepID=A0A103YB30_CYNCS|nr:glutamate receptor 2.8-like [Cynara cardunculus var. scolymus]KVI05815.1 Extracellular ligand-binding receptor [Cynara cardunculus var. scolymus]